MRLLPPRAIGFAQRWGGTRASGNGGFLRFQTLPSMHDRRPIPHLVPHPDARSVRHGRQARTGLHRQASCCPHGNSEAWGLHGLMSHQLLKDADFDPGLHSAGRMGVTAGVEYERAVPLQAHCKASLLPLVTELPVVWHDADQRHKDAVGVFGDRDGTRGAVLRLPQVDPSRLELFGLEAKLLSRPHAGPDGDVGDGGERSR